MPIDLNDIKEIEQNNRSFEKIDFSRSGLCDTDIEVLSKALKTNTVVVRINLSLNRISDEGILKLCAALKDRSNLVELDLSNNNMGDRAAKELSEILKRNNKLNRLSLSHNNINAVGVDYLSEALKINTGLNHLDLSSNPIGDLGVEKLSKALQVNKTLNSLKLVAINLSTKGVKALCEAMRANNHLTNLDIALNNIADKGAYYLSKVLKKNCNLTSLDLSFNEIGIDGIAHLSEALIINSKLNELSLGSDLIYETAISHLSAALKINDSLTSLGLGANNLSAGRVKNLSELFNINNSLTSLDFSFNKMDDKTIQILCDSLKKNSSVIDINFQSNRIGNTGVGYLCEVLKENVCLKSINLEDNIESCSEAFGFLEKTLDNNYTLVDLKMSTKQSWYTIDSAMSGINKSLNRNKALAGSLHFLHEAVNKGIPVLPERYIQIMIDELMASISNLHKLSDDSYPKEAYRLLAALGYFITQSLEAKLEALVHSIPSFKHPGFQKLANLCLGQLLANDVCTLLKEHNLEQQGLLLAIHSLEKYKNQPEIKILLQITWCNLLKQCELTYEQKKEFDKIATLNKQELFNLIKQAINICQQRPLINQHEINLLKQLLLTRSYSFTLTTACQSPAFIQAFKLEFPQATKLTTFDHYLFNNQNPLTPLVIDLEEIPATITETHLTIFMQRVAQDKTETVTELMDVLKVKLHDLATKILATPTPMMTASYQATSSTFFKNTKNKLTSKGSAEKSTVNRLFQSKQL